MRSILSGMHLDASIELLLVLGGRQTEIDIYHDIPTLYLPLHKQYRIAGTFGITSIGVSC